MAWQTLLAPARACWPWVPPSWRENNLSLLGLNLPPNQAGLFFFGDATTSAPVASGIRCIGGSLVRIYPAVITGPGGTAEQPIQLGSAPFLGTLQAGVSHHFQLWYRDVSAGMPTSNFTDGLTIPFD